MRPIALVLLSYLLASCSSIQMISAPSVHQRAAAAQNLSEDSDILLAEEEEDLTSDKLLVEQELMDEETGPDQVAVEVPKDNKKGIYNPFRFFNEEKPLTSEVIEAPLQGLDIQYLDEHFNFWVKYFTERGKDRFIRHLNQGEQYRDIVDQVMNEFNLPPELFYVGLIESGYNSHIRSHASAVGPWQFIRGTATRYGMRVTNSVDERTNIHKSTRAAARYFQDLYNIFGSWELALCAYNSGEYRVINAIRRGATRDYRELVQKKLLPRETIYYVPKVAAARYLSQNRAKYGLTANRRKDDFFINAQEVNIKGSFTLAQVAGRIGVSQDVLKRLNPDILHNQISTPRKGHNLVVPANKVSVAQNLSFNSRAVASTRDDSPVDNTGTYVVKRGDNLSRIANRYRTNVNELKKLNGIRSSRILVGQRLRVPASQNTALSRSYVVRRGDNLHNIARRFNTTVREIVSLNSLNKTQIYPKQRLQIPADS